MTTLLLYIAPCRVPKNYAVVPNTAGTMITREKP